MQGRIYSHKVLIGTTEFKNSFGSMGHMYGDFKPTEAYMSIKNQVQEFFASANRDFEKWDSLRFNVQIENGHFIFPAGGYEIYDSPEYPDEPMEFHIAGVPAYVYEDYFENNKDFLIEPWDTLTIEQKIDFEDELLRETTLTELGFTALAKHRLENDILFFIGQSLTPFAVINLRFREKLEAGEVFSVKNYYPEFDDFVRERMMKDNKAFKSS